MRDANAHELDQPAERPARSLIVDDHPRRTLAGLVGMMVAAGVPIEALPDLSPRKPPRPFTHADEERQQKAEAKRQRKAAKRLKLANPMCSQEVSP